MTAMAIKRGGREPVRRAKAKAPKPSRLGQVFTRLPISVDWWERIATGVVVLAVIVAALTAAVVADVPAKLRVQLDRAVAAAGFVVKRVEVTGVSRMDRLAVYEIAVGQQSRSMSEIDLHDMRARLLRYGWVADARVSRRLPDTLVVDIVERQPAAVWQHGGQLTLVDAAGVPLARVRPDRMPDLPVLIGPGANGQSAALASLLGQTPRLKPLLASATWIGNRRWDLRFQSGEVVSLPEGPAAGEALAKFAALDGRDRLLGRGFVRFDLRDPTRMFVRVRRDMSKPPAPPPAAAQGDDKATGDAGKDVA